MINIQNIRSRKAMTMIELLVAVSVLAILILIFGRVLSKSQAVVTTSQANFEAISTARAIADAFKRDIQQASQAGFLCITQKTGNGNPYLITCAVGASQSKLGTQTGAARITTYGINNSTDQIFCRVSWVLASISSTADVWPLDFSSIQTMSRTNIKNLCYSTSVSSLITNLEATNFTLPLFSNYTDVQNSWKILSTDVTYLSITWTDDGKNWYGIFRGAGTTLKSKYKTPNTNDVTDASTEVEFTPSSPNEAYWALWTKDNPAAWPKAIKISFICKNPQARTTTANAVAAASDTGEKFDIVIPVRP